MRNSREVSTYLHQFSQEGSYQQELYCVLFDEALTSTSVPSSLPTYTSHQPAASDIHNDRYFLFTRYPLYTQPTGQLEAHALRVQNVTEQVRDEKNRSAFLSSISHDLRTPLTTIKAAVTGLLQKDVQWNPQDRYEMLEDINSETDHLTNLVNSLVELSRIEMGALSLEKEWCDVAEVFSNATTKMKTILANHRLRLNHSPHLPLVYADHIQLNRVFTHLLSFAAYRSPEHSEIHVIIDTVPISGTKLRVRIIDQEPLLPEQERERLFTSYHKIPYDEALALSISKRIIEAHQGTIWVEETDEHRMCFTFTLPIHTYVASNAAEQAYLQDQKATFDNQSNQSNQSGE
jgi:K+-sensing histidine kinase KdpD